ncbi:AraC-type DNA-binding protein [Alteromonadaceae bacterium Bs31]|nr:AraC-type DNA-binding protein [Alteromonadaceae bacterium Bs31]
MTSTTLTSWALLIWQSLQEKGINPRPFFTQAGLDPAKLGDGNARYPVNRMHKLWTSLETLDDEYIGITVGQHWSPTTFHALGFAWLASNSLAQAMQRIGRYSRLVNNAFYTSFTAEGSHYRFEVSTTENKKFLHPFGADAGAAAILKMCRMLCGEDFSPVEIYAVRPPSAGMRQLEDLYRRPIHYNSPHASWIIDRFDAERSIASGNSELARINEQIADKALARLEKNDVAGQVKQYIMEALPSGEVDEHAVASELGLSVRSLQRKLSEEKLTFSKMVAEIRQSLALHYIDESHLSLNEIGYLLGFSEQASFTRAFKRWTGHSPSQYRKQRPEQALGAA